MQFTTVRSKEKDYDIYLKSEKLVNWFTAKNWFQQEHEKNVSQLFGSGKNQFLAISSLTNTVVVIRREKKVDPSYLETKKLLQLFGERKKWIHAIWRPKNSSQLLGARKKIMTSI